MPSFATSEGWNCPAWTPGMPSQRVAWLRVAAGLASVGTAGYVVLFTDFMEKVVKYNASRITVWRDPFGGTPEFRRDQARQTIQSLIESTIPTSTNWMASAVPP